MKLFLFVILIFLHSCSFNEFVVNQASPVIEGGIEAIFMESDAEFAREAMAGQLKLLDGFILKSPENEAYLAYGAMGYAAYALGYLENSQADRAKNFYFRAKEYGLRALRLNSDFKEAENQSFDAFKASLDSFSEDDVPALFWTAISWGLYINLSLDDPSSLAKLAYCEEIMKRVYDLDSSYFGGGPSLFFGVLECVKPQMLGGSPERGMNHFKKSWELSNQEFLLNRVFIAQYYTVATLDEEMFDELYKEVMNAEKPKDPKNNLIHAIAKLKMKWLNDNKEDLF